MPVLRERMSARILYCETCGKLIPPEVGEAEDYEALGGAPVCPACLEGSDPGRKQKFDTVRVSRLARMLKLREEIHRAKPPEQVFPAPGSEAPDSPTSTQIREIREELAAEWRAERGMPVPSAKAQAKSAPKLAPASSGSNVQALAGAPDGASAQALEALVLPRRTWMALWTMLVASLLFVLALVAFFPGQEAPAPARPAPPAQGPADLRPESISEPGAHSVEERRRLQLQDLRTIVALLGEQPEPAALAKAVGRLKRLAEVGEGSVRAAASDTLARLQGLVDAVARQAARDAAESARDLAALELFTLAGQSLRRALDALPQDAPWVVQTGRRRLEELAAELEARRAQALGEARARIEAFVRDEKFEEARASADSLLRHPEPEFQRAAAPFVEQLKRAEVERLAVLGRTQEAARAAWPRFFRDLDAALAAGDLKRAAELCQPGATAPLRSGGIEAPAEVLAGFAGEVAKLKELYAATLQACLGLTGRAINLPQSQGNSTGVLKGVDGRQLVLLLENKAEVKWPVERLAPVELEQILGAQQGAAQARYGPALWTLSLARGLPEGSRPETWLGERYAGLRSGVPEHWRRRFALLRNEALRIGLSRCLVELKQAQAASNAQQARAVLAELQALRTEGDALLAPEEREAIAAAERLAGAGKSRHLVFQNGASPTPEYAGIQVDQINRYYKNAERTDVDSHQGLKVGSHNDLQRVLLRFDGLESALGKARIQKATLELYQCAGEKADGAIVALFRLKKAWMPDAGSWLHADQRKKSAWQRPGAAGPEDVEDRPVSQLAINNQKGLWRSWDLTAYVREVVEGKSSNLGLLLRVLKDEPQYHLRFYPDGDLEGKKDPALRPRLVVEAEMPVE